MKLLNPNPPRRRPKRSKFPLAVGLIVLIGSYLGWSLLRPLPPIQPQIVNLPLASDESPTPALAWPASGNAALTLSGSAIRLANGDQSPRPIASVAKVLLALTVLSQKPISSTKTAPMITITDQDVVNYQQEYSAGQSVVAVEAGEQLSEYQALQALLLPSANNIAELLADWAFGSRAAYVMAVNKYAAGLGMTQTKVVDASGFDPGTVSTPTDLLILGQAALHQPIVAEIVAQYQASLPVAGTITNYNYNLKPDLKTGFSGIKTGNTDQAGGCYLFSTKLMGHDLIGAVIGASDLESTFAGSVSLVNSLQAAVQQHKVVDRTTVYATYNLPWAGVVSAHPDKDLVLTDVKGSDYQLTLTASDVVVGQSSAGTISFMAGNNQYSASLVLSQPIGRPSWHWRLTHPWKR